MRSPVSRVPATAILVLAFTGVAVWFHGGIAAPAQAEFLDSIREAKTVKYRMTLGITRPTALTIREEAMELGTTRSRLELDTSDESKIVVITDWGQDKVLALLPAKKEATFLKPNAKNVGNDPAVWIHLLQVAPDNKIKEFQREPLGEKEIDGRRVVGIRLRGDGCPAIDLWGDPQTGLPIRIEGTTGPGGMIKATLSDFVFNVELDESLLSVQPPDGYTVRNEKIDNSPNEEKDLIEMFREYTKLTDGVFPDSLDEQRTTSVFWIRGEIRSQWERLARAMGKANDEKRRHKFEEQLFPVLDRMMDRIMQQGMPDEAEMRKIAAEMQKPGNELVWEEIAPEKVKGNEELRLRFVELMMKTVERTPKETPQRTFDEEIRKIGGDQMLKALKAHNARWMEAEDQDTAEAREAKSREFGEAQQRVRRGVRFANQLPSSADAHYAGKGVSLSTADKPIFWYRPKDAKKYRVVYADLSVRDADAPANVSDAQAVSAAAGPKK